MKQEYIEESFNKTGGNKLNSLGIGKRMLIQKWIDEHITTPDDCTINNDLTISTTQDINFDHNLNGNLPEYIQFDKVSGYFSVSGNKMTSLRGCPKFVYSSFYCDDNDLTTLEYGPSYVGKDIICTQNQISVETLYKEINKIEGFKTAFTDHGEYYGSSYKKINRKKIDESFKKSDDKLATMRIGKKAMIEKWINDHPQSDSTFSINEDLSIDVSGHLYLDNCIKGNFPDYIQFNKCSGYFSISYNKMTSLRGCPKYVGETFYCDNNNLTSLEYASEVIMDDLQCEYNKIPKEILEKQVWAMSIGKIAYTDAGVMKIYNIEKKIDESFVKSDEKLKKLNIGKINLIKAWLEKYNVQHYFIEDDMKIDIVGHLNLSDKHLYDLPSYIKFGIITGYFNVSGNNFTTMKGFPDIVQGDFYCSANNFINIDDMPLIRGGLRFCYRNPIPIEDFKKKYSEVKHRSEESFNESFVKSDDKLSSLGIGRIKSIEKWIEDYLTDEINAHVITINDDLSINCVGNVYLNNMLKGNLPDYIQFKDVDGYFSISNNEMTSLRGCPIHVNRDFYCAQNRLETFEYAPTYVGGDFFVTRNKVSLKLLMDQLSKIFIGRITYTDYGQMVEKDFKKHLELKESFSKTDGDKLDTLEESFIKSNDKLSSLGVGKIAEIKKWLEKYKISNYEINDDFTIDAENVTIFDKKELEYLPDYINFNTISGFFAIIRCDLKSLRGCPKTVLQTFNISNNSLSSLEFEPTFVGNNYWCYNNNLPISVVQQKQANNRA